MIAPPLLIAITACAPVFDQIGDRYSTAGAEWILTNGFDNIAAVHIDEVDLSVVALGALRGLQELEPSLGITRHGDRLLIRIAGSELGEVRLPSSQAPADWARAATRALDLARAASSALAHAPAERLFETMFDGALAGLDRYSRYASAEEARENRANREGFGGIGVTIERFDDRVLIIAVIPDTPAARAGVKANDHLLEVDEVAVDDLAIHEIVRLVRGPVEATTRLLLKRGADPDPLSVTVRRALIVPPTVSYEVVDGAAVVRVSGFNQDTAQRLGDILEEIAQGAKAGAMRGAVLDLRANPGGLLDQAVAVADLFLEDGQIVSTRGRHPDSMQLFDAGGRDLIEGLPVAVLINGSSASAAEIVAAALQDRGRAVLIGSSSYGKGTVQTVIRLPNDAELTLTWARIHAPSGYALDRLGVLPIICTSRTGVDPDLMMDSLQGGRLAGLTDLARRRAADYSSPGERDPAPADCPWRPSERTVDIDLKVAKRVVVDRRLYAGALAAQAPLIAKTDRSQEAAHPTP
ncbi:MAG: S41 family peptidase [Kiloniellales bacterium]